MTVDSDEAAPADRCAGPEPGAELGEVLVGAILQEGAKIRRAYCEGNYLAELKWKW